MQAIAIEHHEADHRGRVLRALVGAHERRGLALVFANFPINRIGFALIHANDEQYVTWAAFTHSAWGFWLTNVAIWLCAIPPLVFAYRAIANRRRLLWFLGFFILPFVFVFVFAGMFLENWLLLEKKFMATPVLGIPYLILLVEAISLGLYLTFRRGIEGRAKRGTRNARAQRRTN